MGNKRDSALKVDSRIYNSYVSYWKLYLCFMGLSLYGYVSVCFVQVLSLCKIFSFFSPLHNVKWDFTFVKFYVEILGCPFGLNL